MGYERKMCGEATLALHWLCHKLSVEVFLEITFSVAAWFVIQPSFLLLSHTPSPLQLSRRLLAKTVSNMHLHMAEHLFRLKQLGINV